MLFFSFIFSMEFDSAVFNDAIEDHILEGDRTFRSIVHGKVQTDIENIGTVLKDEMDGMSPELPEKIATSIASSDVDRSKFRDLFLIKKRTITDGKKNVVSFEIQERVIPKEPSFSQLQRNTRLTFIFVIILFLLSGLVLTTTMKMYQNLIKLKYIRRDYKI